ncbi:MAG TPA: TrbG/VirB9 family P-type conjugative transfer protein [Sphingomicrobium sp.]|nr:TrbG/VirB9 family P-type conjugative transfer protein [Sphingomicrobium sp.]
MRRGTILCAMLLLAAAPASAMAAVEPAPGNGDPHLQQVDYAPGEVVQLRGAPGYELMVELSADEQVQSVALGDNSAWQVSVNKAGDRLFLKPALADSATNMTVVTSIRVYHFDLAALAGPTPDMPYSVRFLYPAQKPAAHEEGYVDVAAATRAISRYKVSGDRQLWPSSITDDGQHIYIQWPRTASIPAIYTTDRAGNEVLVNGMMGTDDVYVVDGAPQRLTFRIDRNVAHAVRIVPKKRR